MTNPGTTTFFLLKPAALSSGFNGKGGISFLMLFLLDGRFLHTFTIPLVCWFRTTCLRLVYLVLCTLMTDTMASCKFGIFKQRNSRHLPLRLVMLVSALLKLRVFDLAAYTLTCLGYTLGLKMCVFHPQKKEQIPRFCLMTSKRNFLS